MRLFRLELMPVLMVVAACASAPGQERVVGPCTPIVAGEADRESMQIRHTGELTRKGSDTDSWWALRVESGTLYRLKPADGDMEKSFAEWQNSRVAVEGTLGGKFLSFDVICVRVAYLATDDSGRRLR